MTIALRYTVRTDVGLLRDGNEDSAYAGPHLLAIADGMGGHAAGEVASAVAIATLAPLDADPAGIDMLQALGDAIASANTALRQITLTDPTTEGMGTTLTALLWSGDAVALCHIGDSRGYLLRDGMLKQITHDHTLVQSLVDEGKLTPEAAASHPQRSLVMRALQSSIPADPDLEMLQARVGDRYLLCSDGLTDVVTDETLRMTLAELPDLEAAVEQLVDLAIRSGGPDNITCVLADVIDTDGGQGATEEVIVVGALASGADPDNEPTRSDNPASRAHQLTLGSQPAPDGSLTGPGGDPGNALNVASFIPAPMTEPAPPASDVAEGEEPASEGDVEEEEDDTWPRHAARRRWPVVTGVLILLFGVIGAAGYYGWRLTQNQYYVGTANGRVVVFRGLSQAVAGVSFSKVVQRTNIPLAALPATEAGSIRSTIGPESNLTQAQRIISQFRQDYRCSVVQADITKWVANRPKPKPPAHKSKSAGTQGKNRKHPAKKPGTTNQTTTKHASSKQTSAKPAAGKQTTGTAGAKHAKTTHQVHATKSASHTVTKPSSKNAPAKHQATRHVSYPPEPKMPNFCPAYSGAAG
jgi:PPM family protein phosphatase